MVSTRKILFRQLPHFWYFGDVSVEQVETAILGLSHEDRQRLTVWFEENRRELLSDAQDELGEHQQAEVVRRRYLAAAHPELLEPWDGAIERVRARLHPPPRS